MAVFVFLLINTGFRCDQTPRKPLDILRKREPTRMRIPFCWVRGLLIPTVPERMIQLDKRK